MARLANKDFEVPVGSWVGFPDSDPLGQVCVVLHIGGNDPVELALTSDVARRLGYSLVQSADGLDKRNRSADRDD